MRVRIHRGATQIGGTCIEVEARGFRIVLDIGMPLDSPDPEAVDMPAVSGFSTTDPTLLGVVLSHPHLDHYGLAARLPGSTVFLMGAAAECILKAAADFTPSGGVFAHVIHLSDRQRIELGPFRITPYLMDHSAYDSYAVLVEADGQRLFYTGDLRGHGRKAGLFELLVSQPPAGVDVLLMEGTTIQRQGTDVGFPTETDLEQDLVRIFQATAGMPLVWCSGQNIDRLVTVFRAAKRSGRRFIMDMYTAHILAATDNPRLPQSHWNEVSVFLPFSQKLRIVQDKSFWIADKYRLDRMYPEQLAVAAKGSVVLFRPNMRRDLEQAGCLGGACLVYSMWDGYLRDEKMQPFLAWLEKRGIPLHKCHTSGHASLHDLHRLRDAFASALVVPIHTQQPELYADLFGNVQVHGDGEWWDVGDDAEARRAGMTTVNDNAVLGKRLREACEDGQRGVKLPSAISFTSNGATVLMHLDSSCVEANMQENATAFEGWALALKRWLPDVAGVELGWDFAGVDSDPHYQRFLYRAKKFQSLFHDWFEIAPANTAEFGRLKTEAAGHEFILNVASKPRALEPAGECDCLGCAQLNEHRLECHIVRNQEPLCKLLGVDSLDRQLPVGVFMDSVSAASDNEIFPRSKSAIDLWGVNKCDSTLFLFELKKRGNIPLGILSELFFYSFVMADVQAERFRFEKPTPEIQATETIAAYILAPEWHPLIDGDMLGIVNAAFNRSGHRIGFGAVRIEPAETEKYRIVAQP